MAWACNPGSAMSVGCLWGHSQGGGGWGWEPTLTHPGHTGTWQRKGGRGTGFQTRVLGQTQRQGAESPQGVAHNGSMSLLRDVQRWAEAGMALRCRLRHCSHTLGCLSLCALRSAHRRMEREVGNAGPVGLLSSCSIVCGFHSRGHSHFRSRVAAGAQTSHLHPAARKEER